MERLAALIDNIKLACDKTDQQIQFYKTIVEKSKDIMDDDSLAFGSTFLDNSTGAAQTGDQQYLAKLVQSLDAIKHFADGVSNIAQYAEDTAFAANLHALAAVELRVAAKRARNADLSIDMPQTFKAARNDNFAENARDIAAKAGVTSRLARSAFIELRRLLKDSLKQINEVNSFIEKIGQSAHHISALADDIRQYSDLEAESLLRLQAWLKQLLEVLDGLRDHIRSFSAFAEQQEIVKSAAIPYDGGDNLDATTADDDSSVDSAQEPSSFLHFPEKNASAQNTNALERNTEADIIDISTKKTLSGDNAQYDDM
ncbi:MAG: hypothetical protein LBL96_10570 [Clostridiales bacterium]|jgi:signal transduction histidine kinase|nr:hypothetical protein [Clostridiales bacterium]